MIDSVDTDSSPIEQNANATPPQDPEPLFGIVDLVDAFTAMRHEWRHQSRQNSELAQAFSDSITQLNQLEASVDSKLQIAGEDARLKNLIFVIIELDISLQRAIEALSDPRTGIEASQTGQFNRQLDGIQLSIKQQFDKLGFFRRWLARSFFRDINEIISTRENRESTDGVLEGLQMILTRLRTLMSEHHLVRTETLGQPFNAETMSAVSSVASDTCAPDTVAEEISPAYFYQSQLIKYAQVRVARPPDTVSSPHNTLPEPD